MVNGHKTLANSPQQGTPHGPESLQGIMNYPYSDKVTSTESCCFFFFTGGGVEPGALLTSVSP